MIDRCLTPTNARGAPKIRIAGTSDASAEAPNFAALRWFSDSRLQLAQLENRSRVVHSENENFGVPPVRRPLLASPTRVGRSIDCPLVACESWEFSYGLMLGRRSQPSGKRFPG